MRPLWTARLPASPASLHLAREGGEILIRDVAGHLSLHDAAGQPIVRRAMSGVMSACALSEDGNSFACGMKSGKVLMLRGGLTPGWDQGLPGAVAGMALDALGHSLAVADESGGLTVFDRTGRTRWRATTPRPLVHLAWVAETGTLAGCAEFGLVCLYDAAGKCLWRDGLMANAGGMSSSGAGRLLVACYSEGLKRYGEQGKLAALGRARFARRVAQSYAGDTVLTVGVEGTELVRCDMEGAVLGEAVVPAPVAGLAMDALGGWAVVALAGGEMTRLEW